MLQPPRKKRKLSSHSSAPLSAKRLVVNTNQLTHINNIHNNFIINNFVLSNTDVPPLEPIFHHTMTLNDTGCIYYDS